MNWILAIIPVLVLALVVLALLRRHEEARSSAQNYQERLSAKASGSHKARLQYPDIDLSKCIGCGACVRECPEEGVLSLLHGQAVIMHGARCVGHGRCADACPTAGIALTLGDLADRKDLPALEENLEAVNVPGLYVAGELTGFALVRTAVTHGAAVAEAVARHREHPGSNRHTHNSAEADQPEELLIVGSGPAGLSCGLRAKELGIRLLMIEQEDRIGGTVAGYPRRKMVMTQPVELPLHGRLPKLTYQKEELIDIWESVSQTNDLPIRTGVRMIDFQRDPDGVFVVSTTQGTMRAKNLCLALGRRGTPRKLGAPGEDLPKVAYSLLDAESYQGRRILVVGGGDSAVEAAIGLSEQPGNQVTLSYRKKAFNRLKARNEKRVQQAIKHNRLDVLFESEVEKIQHEEVMLRSGMNGSTQRHSLANDDVFIFAGGIPPFSLLEEGGVSFDPNDHPQSSDNTDNSKGMLTGLLILLVCAVIMFGWVTWYRAYYDLAGTVRAGSPDHSWLRPSGPIGLTFGVLACVLFVCNLAYLIRRSPKWGNWIPGTLKQWMSGHIFTGLLALLCVLFHSGFTMRDAVGGHALIALIVVVVTGTIGRYLYAFIPRAANGREIDLDDLCAQLATQSAEWDRDGRGFGTKVRLQVDALIHAGRWRPGFIARVWALVTGQFRLRRVLHDLRTQGHQEDIPADELNRTLMLASRAYRVSQMAAHYEEVRAVLSSWRYLHRWLALLMVLLTVIHVVTAVLYADLSGSYVPNGDGP